MVFKRKKIHLHIYICASSTQLLREAYLNNHKGDFLGKFGNFLPKPRAPQWTAESSGLSLPAELPCAGTVPRGAAEPKQTRRERELEDSIGFILGILSLAIQAFGCFPSQ